MTVQRTTRFLAVALLVLPFALAACGGKSSEATGGTSGGQTTEVSGGGISASCAFIVEFDGHDYFGNGVEVTPVAGESLGTGTIPPCDDTGGALEPTAAEEVEVTEIRGVPPTVAIMLAGRTDVVLVRDDVQKLPKELQPR
jgi:uncharacterized protein DUF6281